MNDLTPANKTPAAIIPEVMGLITGTCDAKSEGFAPGGLTLHNMMNAHGPDAISWRAATDADQKPHKMEGTMAFMVESCLPFRPTAHALGTARPGSDAAWADFPKAKIK